MTTSVGPSRLMLTFALFFFSMPTLFFAECVLIYLEPKYSTQLMEWVAKNFKTCLFINYDPVSFYISVSNSHY